MEFDLLAFLIGCVIGGIVGWRVCDHFHISLTTDLLKAVGVGESQLKRAIENLQADLPQDTEEAMLQVEVKVEQVNEQLYVYRLDTMEFLCQGFTRDDIIAKLTDRFHTDLKIVISDENGGQYLKESPTG
jgi:hypothetical protein